MKKKKVLFVATVVKTHIMPFHLPVLKMFQKMGYETAVAARNDYENPEECNIPYCDTYYDIPFERFPLKKQNFHAYKQLKKIIDDNRFDIIHCHTPVGGFLGRLCSIKARTCGTKVIYTAHGFHFYKGAPLKNWLIYYPIEKLCSRLTDLLITINQEDYALAQKKMKAKHIAYVPGVGIDLQKFSVPSVSSDEKRAELGIPDGAFLMLSVGELNRNKNHEVVLRAMSLLSDPNIHYAIAGAGDLREYLLSLSEELGIRDHVHLLGYRKDVAELYRAADVFVFPSFREGLSVSLMEAMASGLPCLVSDIRGNRDLIDETGGMRFDPSDVRSAAQGLRAMMSSDLTLYGNHNAGKVSDYSTGRINELMKKLYLKSLNL